MKRNVIEIEKISRPRRVIDEIVVHCTATPAGHRVSVEDIDSWHRARGYKCIGYHYLVDVDGSVYAGRDVNRIGAHALGHNARSIGVCYVGGLSADGSRAMDTRTEDQREALRKLVAQLRKLIPGARVVGHNELTCTAGTERRSVCGRRCMSCRWKGKACPSFDIVDL